MTMSDEIINPIRLDLMNNSNQVGTIGKIFMVENQAWIKLMWVLIEMIDMVFVETTSTVLNTPSQGEGLPNSYHIDLLHRPLKIFPL